jgi:hypothetical protein
MNFWKVSGPYDAFLLLNLPQASVSVVLQPLAVFLAQLFPRCCWSCVAVVRLQLIVVHICFCNKLTPVGSRQRLALVHSGTTSSGQ